MLATAPSLPSWLSTPPGLFFVGVENRMLDMDNAHLTVARLDSAAQYPAANPVGAYECVHGSQDRAQPANMGHSYRET